MLVSRRFGSLHKPTRYVCVTVRVKLKKERRIRSLGHFFNAEARPGAEHTGNPGLSSGTRSRQFTLGMKASQACNRSKNDGE